MRFFDLFAEIFDLLAQRIDENVDFFLAAFGKALRFLIEDIVCQRLELIGESLLRFLQQSDLLSQVLAFVLEFGLKLADSGGLGARPFSACLQFSAYGIAFGSEEADGLFALCGNGFEAGTGGGLGLRLRQFGLQRGKYLSVFAIALFEHCLFGLRGERANPEANPNPQEDRNSDDHGLHHLSRLPLRLMYAFLLWGTWHN